MPKPGKSAASQSPSAKYGTLMPNSKSSAIKGGAPPKVMTNKHGSGLIASAKKAK